MERPFDYPGRHSDFSEITLNLPQYWASAFINGDFGPYEQDEADAIRAFLQKEVPGCVYTYQSEEPQSGFLWNHDASNFWPVGSMCEEFTFRYRI